jgi:hypothetical protein
MADKVQRPIDFRAMTLSGTQFNAYERGEVDALHASIIDQGRKVLNATSEIGMSHAEYIEWVMERLEGNDSTLAAHPSPI